MEVYAGLAEAAGHLDGAAVTIGNFDGVHLGHRRLVERTLAHARARGTAAAALTFRPHPARVLAPDRAPPLICSVARRRELLAEAGLDALVEQPFDAAFAATSAQSFTDLLLDRLGARSVVVGHDFTYGRARQGNIETLRAACSARGALLEVVDAVTVDGLVVSSTKVREFVLAGNVEAARALLGRPFDLQGLVVHGDARGRTIGVPTANVSADSDLLPGLGVYAVRVRMPDGSLRDGACNVGLNPTFRPGGADAAVSVEAHVLDWSGELYGRPVRLLFVARLRAEARFSSVDELVAQIRRDVERTREILAADRSPG